MCRPQGQSFSRAHFNTSRWPPSAALSHVVLSQSHPFERAYFKVSKCPPFAAPRHVDSSHQKSFSRNQWSISVFPNSAANALALVARHLIAPGDEVVIQDPVDFLVAESARRAGAELRLWQPEGGAYTVAGLPAASRVIVGAYPSSITEDAQAVASLIPYSILTKEQAAKVDAADATLRARQGRVRTFNRLLAARCAFYAPESGCPALSPPAAARLASLLATPECEAAAHRKVTILGLMWRLAPGVKSHVDADKGGPAG